MSKPRRPAAAEHDLAADQHRVDVAGAGAHQKQLARIDLGRDPGPGHARQVDQHQIGGVAGRDGAEGVRLAQQAGAARRRHVEDPFRRRRRPVEARRAMQAHGEAHLVEIVLVVIDRRAIHAEGDGDAAREQRVERRDAGAQPQVRARVVRDCRPGLGEHVDLRLGQPDAVGDRKSAG